MNVSQSGNVGTYHVDESYGMTDLDSGARE